MFKTEKQQCEAICCLLASLNLHRFWTLKGPTRQACEALEGSPLSSGEQVMLRVAFDFWNGAGKVMLYRDLMGTLDSTRLFKVATRRTNGQLSRSFPDYSLRLFQFHRLALGISSQTGLDERRAYRLVAPLWELTPT